MTEIWKMICKTTLSNLCKYEASIGSMMEELALEKSKIKSIKCATSEATPVKGGGNKFEDNIINGLCKMDLLHERIQLTRRDVELSRRALSMLSEEEQRILDVMYITKQKSAVDRLCDEFCCDESTVWRKTNKALQHYCIARYGKE